MGLLVRWRESRERAGKRRTNLKMNSDPALIASHAPELSGMSEVDGMAYVLRAIESWNEDCSQDEMAIFRARLKASTESWEQDDLAMPYWGNLSVLRTYQAELGRLP